MKALENKMMIPSKKSMNLYVKEKTGNSPSIVIPLFIFLAVLVVAFAKFAVYDRYIEIAKIESEHKTSVAKYQEAIALTKDYKNLKEEYFKLCIYDEDKALINRYEALMILNDATSSLATLNTFDLKDNKLEVNFSAYSIEAVTQIQNKLLANDKIASCAVINEEKKDNVPYPVVTTLEIVFKEGN